MTPGKWSFLCLSRGKNDTPCPSKLPDSYGHGCELVSNLVSVDPKMECAACFELASEFVVWDCGHKICVECFPLHYEAARNKADFVIDKISGFLSINCYKYDKNLQGNNNPCNTPISSNHLFCLLGKEAYSRHKTYMTESRAIKNGMLYCPFNNCAKLFMPSHIGKFQKCPHCAIIFCRVCRNRKSQIEQCKCSFDENSVRANQQENVDNFRDKNIPTNSIYFNPSPMHIDNLGFDIHVRHGLVRKNINIRSNDYIGYLKHKFVLQFGQEFGITSVDQFQLINAGKELHSNQQIKFCNFSNMTDLVMILNGPVNNNPDTVNNIITTKINNNGIPTKLELLPDNSNNDEFGGELDGEKFRCPNCSARVVHYYNEGCHKIRDCPSCHVSYCYVCRKDWNIVTQPGNQHKCPLFCNSTCGCPKAPERKNTSTNNNQFLMPFQNLVIHNI